MSPADVLVRIYLDSLAAFVARCEAFVFLLHHPPCFADVVIPEYEGLLREQADLDRRLVVALEHVPEIDRQEVLRMRSRLEQLEAKVVNLTARPQPRGE